MAPIVRSEATGPRLAVLNDDGLVVQEISLEREETVLGRASADVRFDDDESVSPQHAVLTWRDNLLCVRDLGSANGSWLFITEPHPLAEGDLLLVGSQVIRYRVLPPRSIEVSPVPLLGDAAVVPVRDVAMLEQLRPDGSVRDVLYLSPGRSVLIGREHGDWVFPYDHTMSARHAEVRPMAGTLAESILGAEAQDSLFTVRDMGSRNGVGLLVRGERTLRAGERLLVGRKMLRLDVS